MIGVEEWSEVMNFLLKNFGKIAAADIKLDGITVICGNNNTGKSTVGKALFSFFNSLHDYKNQIAIEKLRTIRAYASRYSFITNSDELLSLIASHDEAYSSSEVKNIIEKYFPEKEKITKEKIEALTVYLNSSESDILAEYVFRYFNQNMNGQIKRTDSGRERCFVTAKFKSGIDSISFTQKDCNCSIDESLSNTAYYINSPFVIDSLNRYRTSFYGMTHMERNVVEAIIDAQEALNQNMMSGILESVSNKKDLEEVEKVLKQAYSGDTKIDHGQYFYIENGFPYDFRNISAGLKSFAIIERLLETGVLKRKDVLILDEPEIHLHSEWQIIYAELIVVLQKKFDLTILLVTHSNQFLESLIFFMKEYGISERGNYYIPTQTEKGTVIVDDDNNLTAMKKSLKSGVYRLANMQLDELREEDNDEENNE